MNNKISTHPKGFLILNFSKDSDALTLFHTAYENAGRQTGMKVNMYADAYDDNGNIIEDSSAIVIVGELANNLNKFYRIADTHPAMISARSIILKSVEGY